MKCSRARYSEWERAGPHIGCVRDHVLGRSSGWARVRVKEGAEAEGRESVLVVDPILKVRERFCPRVLLL